MPLFPELQEMMLEHRFRPDKRLSQNFVVDERLIAKIVDCAGLAKKDVVLEVGCGTGFLTRELLKHCNVIGFEKDETLCKLLRSSLGHNKNFDLRKADFLGAGDLAFNKVVSLPPYNISGEVLQKILMHGFDTAVLVFQREFVNKVVAQPGFYDYGHLSALAAIFYDHEVPIYNISPLSFHPKPEAYSSMLVLSAKKNKPEFGSEEMRAMSFFIKSIFRFKNKNLSNAVSHCTLELEKAGFKKTNVEKGVAAFGLASRKVNLLEPDEILGLFRKIC